MSLLQILQQQLDDQALGALQQQTGADSAQVQNAVQAALPMLLGGLAGNASKPEGAQGLWAALAKDHDGGLLSNLGGFLGSAEAPQQGQAILKHVLGGKQPQAEQALAGAAGLDTQKAGTMLAALAPMVMGMLGKMQDDQQIGDQQQLQSLLAQEKQSLRQQPQAAGLLNMLLDEDGDGQVGMDEVVRRGGGLLSKFFGKR